MTINRVKPAGWGTKEELTSLQATALDVNGASALDKRGGQTDTCASNLTFTGTCGFANTCTFTNNNLFSGTNTFTGPTQLQGATTISGATTLSGATTIAQTVVWQAAVVPKFTAVAFSASISIDLSTGNTFQLLAASGNTTITLSGAQPGALYTISFLQDGSGSHTITWPGTIDFGTLSGTADGTAFKRTTWLFLGQGSGLIALSRNVTI